MHATTEEFISKHSYFSRFLWNLFTDSLKGSIMESNDEFHMEPFEVPNTYQGIEPFKVLFSTFCL